MDRSKGGVLAMGRAPAVVAIHWKLLSYYEIILSV